MKNRSLATTNEGASQRQIERNARHARENGSPAVWMEERHKKQAVGLDVHLAPCNRRRSWLRRLWSKVVVGKTRSATSIE